MANKEFINSLVAVLVTVWAIGVLSACTSPLDAGNIDLESWNRDRYGCSGLRIKDVEELKAIKNTFLAKSNQELIKTFGRPDRVLLADKSQSFFIYFLEPADNCGGGAEKEPLKVLFRLNAVSKVSEVTVTTLNP